MGKEPLSYPVKRERQMVSNMYYICSGIIMLCIHLCILSIQTFLILCSLHVISLRYMYYVCIITFC